MKLRFDAHDAARARSRRLAARRGRKSRRCCIRRSPICPGHEYWKRDFTGAGGLFSVIFDERYTRAQTDRFVDA